MHSGAPLVCNTLLGDDPDVPIYTFSRRSVGYWMVKVKTLGDEWA